MNSTAPIVLHRRDALGGLRVGHDGIALQPRQRPHQLAAEHERQQRADDRDARRRIGSLPARRRLRAAR